MNDQAALDVEAAGAVTRIPALRIIMLVLQLVRFVGRVVALVTFAALAVLEPLVRLLLMSLAILGMLIMIVFGFLIAADSFPKWTMLETAVACFLLLGAYYWVMKTLNSIAAYR